MKKESNPPKKVLIVVAHPDDEILGCGATAYMLSTKNIEVECCILSGFVDARKNRPKIIELNKDINSAHKIIGIKNNYLGEFPNINFNIVPHWEMVKFIESIIIRSNPTHIFTHHPGDLNIDHYYTSLACQAASRIVQRQTNKSYIKGLYYMEILSSTDWSFPGSNNAFVPDTFFEIGPIAIEKKVESLKAYRGVIRDFPHPRSIENLKSLSINRGCQAGLDFAEAFQTAYHKMDYKEFENV